MVRRIIYSVCILLVAICPSCSDNNLVEESFVNGEEVCANIHFGHIPFEKVDIKTRATLNVVAESRVLNMFVYAFTASDGKRVYAHYFDMDEMESNSENVENANRNCWYVDNMGEGEDPSTNPTNGIIRIKAPKATNVNIYLVANIDADMVNISPEKLNLIHSESDLLELTATLNQEITSRNGYFPMTAVVKGVNIAENGQITADTKAELERLDAKVEVEVKVATGHTTVNTDADGTVTQQILKDFKPESWRVVNLPKGTYSIKRQANDYEEAGYFDTQTATFETSKQESYTYTDVKGETKTVQRTVNGFSFYMLENQEEEKKSVGTNYHLRDKRIKNAAGAYDESNGLWEYAPENATYMVVKGQLEMDVDVSNNAKQQHLAAEVEYYIHLGDFAANPDDYSIGRNTHYTYTVIIKGVNSIEVEVRTSHAGTFEEKESGATGMVYIAEEEIQTFDAHYDQRVYMLDAASIDPDNVTWYVSTPFSEGMPKIIAGTEVPAGLDYKWVQFMVNQWADKGKTTYTRNNQSYPGYKGNPNQPERSDSLMDVVEFTKYIKNEVRNLKAGKSSVFRKEKDEDWYNWYKSNNPSTTLTIEDDGIWWRDRLYVTVFVNEFYYETDPITDNTREGLWKEFVNQPNRLMHILCDNQESLDKASSSTGSVVTIRQRSIQTPYNITKNSLKTGWGCETVDESDAHFWFYSPSETDSYTPTAITANNTSRDNGLYNTACLWQLVKDETFATDPLKWEDYVDYNRANPNIEDLGDPLYMVSDKRALLYAPMMRNRDNNGNGYIDADEVRWYIASLGQIYGLYMGQLGLNGDAILYPVSRPGLKETTYDAGPYAGYNQYRNHIVTSYSVSPNSHPQRLWAEEGLTVDGYGVKFSYGNYTAFSIRCVRNLGMDYASETEAQVAIANANVMPEDLVGISSLMTYTDADGEEKTKYQFDLSNINDKSIRYYTTRELEPGDEYSEMSRVYYGFETGELVTITGKYKGLKAMLEKGESPCPNGYHVPNIRESALMMLYCTDGEWWGDRSGYYLMSTYYSLGEFGTTYKDLYNGYSWFYNGNGHMTAGYTRDNNNIRCVRDWEPPLEE